MDGSIVFCRLHQYAPIETQASLGSPESISQTRNNIAIGSEYFWRFCMAHDRDSPTDGTADHVTPSVTTGRTYVRSPAMQSKN